MAEAEIRFYEELNDFLPGERKKRSYILPVHPGQSIKDLIESENVPHPEVDLILVNGESVDFTYIVRDKDRISVYPVFETLDISGATRLRPCPLREPSFILDVHLGKLARYLRIAGFDSLYSNSYKDEEITDIAARESRIILTRDRGLLKRSIVERGCWIRSQNPYKQLKEVISRFSLGSMIRPLTICPVCNGRIYPVEKSRIADRLPPKTALYFNEFSKCSMCGRIFWKGSHFRGIEPLLETIRSMKN